MVATVAKETEVVVYPEEFTEEVAKKLAAPVPQAELKTKNQGGTTITYTSDKFVEHRLNGVVGVAGWQDDYVTVAYGVPVAKTIGAGTKQERETLILGTVTCHLKVLGILKSGQADIEYDPRMYGTPATNAQARAFKRAAKKFRIASELWDKGEGDVEEEVAVEQPVRKAVDKAVPARQSQSSGDGPTPSQVSWLTTGADGKPGLGVPMAVVRNLTQGRGGTASALMEALFTARRKNKDDYEDDPIPYIRQALEKVDPSLVPLLGDDDDDED